MRQCFRASLFTTVGNYGFGADFSGETDFVTPEKDYSTLAALRIRSVPFPSSLFSSLRP